MAAGLALVSCGQVTQQAGHVPTAANQANDRVQSAIKELGLVCVEEGAQDVVTYDEANAAQQAWCDALVRIGQIKQAGGGYRAHAEQVLSEAYNPDQGKVFFKPTLACGDQAFRTDKGFALTPWVKARHDNAGANNEGIQIYGSVAITMGNVWVTDAAGKEVMVDKTWVFRKGKDGKLRIIVHKSALPFAPG